LSDRVVLEGFHAVKHALRFGAEVERIVAVDRDAALRLARDLAPDLVDVFERRLEEVPAAEVIALASRQPHTGVVGIARRPAEGELARDAPVVLLEEPRDFGNVGAVVRVAAAAGAGGVVVTGDRDPWAPEALRGSAGLHFALPVLRSDDVPAGRPLIAFDPAGEPFDPRSLADDAVLAFGTERDGLSDALKRRADAVAALPMRSGVSSLNLATSVAAALYAWRLG
jgi:RNA methyltransferase, TrmH family